MSRLIYMQYMNSLESTTWWAVLYIEDSYTNNDNDDSVAWLHGLTGPLTNSTKNLALYDSLKTSIQKDNNWHSFRLWFDKAK